LKKSGKSGRRKGSGKYLRGRSGTKRYCPSTSTKLGEFSTKISREYKYISP